MRNEPASTRLRDPLVAYLSGLGLQGALEPLRNKGIETVEQLASLAPHDLAAAGLRITEVDAIVRERSGRTKGASAASVRRGIPRFSQCAFRPTTATGAALVARNGGGGRGGISTTAASAAPVASAAAIVTGDFQSAPIDQPSLLRGSARLPPCSQGSDVVTPSSAPTPETRGCGSAGPRAPLDDPLTAGVVALHTEHCQRLERLGGALVDELCKALNSYERSVRDLAAQRDQQLAEVAGSCDIAPAHAPEAIERALRLAVARHGAGALLRAKVTLESVVPQLYESTPERAASAHNETAGRLSPREAAPRAISVSTTSTPSGTQVPPLLVASQPISPAAPLGQSQVEAIDVDELSSVSSGSAAPFGVSPIVADDNDDTFQCLAGDDFEATQIDFDPATFDLPSTPASQQRAASVTQTPRRCSAALMNRKVLMVHRSFNVDQMSRAEVFELAASFGIRRVCADNRDHGCGEMVGSGSDVDMDDGVDDDDEAERATRDALKLLQCRGRFTRELLPTMLKHSEKFGNKPPRAIGVSAEKKKRTRRGCEPRGGDTDLERKRAKGDSHLAVARAALGADALLAHEAVTPLFSGGYRDHHSSAAAAPLPLFEQMLLREPVDVDDVLHLVRSEGASVPKSVIEEGLVAGGVPQRPTRTKGGAPIAARAHFAKLALTSPS